MPLSTKWLTRDELDTLQHKLEKRMEDMKCEWALLTVANNSSRPSMLSWRHDVQMDDVDLNAVEPTEDRGRRTRRAHLAYEYQKFLAVAFHVW